MGRGWVYTLRMIASWHKIVEGLSEALLSFWGMLLMLALLMMALLSWFVIVSEEL
jgi:hypothetical protein